MLQLFYQVFVALALVSGIAADVKCITADEPFGGHGGKRFQDNVTRDTNITGIILRSDERLDAIGIVVDNVEWKLHGGDGGYRVTHLLDGKKITEMEVHKAKNGHHLKVVFVKFTVYDGQSFQGGSEDNRLSDNIQKFKAPVKGGYLIGFIGRAKAEVNALGGLWLDPKCVKNLEKGSNSDIGDDDDDDDDDNDDDDNDDDGYQY